MADRSIVVRLRAEVSDFKKQMDDAAKSTNKLPESAKRAETALGGMVQSASKNREAWDRAGGALVAFGGATLAGLGLATKAALDWESAWTGVLKTVDGSAEQIAALEVELRRMAQTLPASHQEIAAVAEAAGQLGVAVEDVADFTRTMINLGETTNLSADEAATALARIANIMGTTSDDVARMGATIVDLGNNSATTEREIVELGTRLAAAGAQAGLSEADIFAFASALTSVGVEAEAGGTAMSKVFTSIADATRDGGDKLETFARVAGVSVADFRAAFEQDAAAAITMFVEGMGRMASEGQSTTAVFEELELTDQRLMRAILSTGSASGLLADQLGLANDAWEENSALVEEALKRYDTTEAKMQIARNSINDAAITLGETFLPALASAAEGVAGFAQAVGSLPDPLLRTGGGLAAAAGAATLAGGGFLMLFPRVMETAQAFKTLQTDMPRVAGALRGVGAAAGAAAGVVVMAQAFEALGDAWSDRIWGRSADITQLAISLRNFARDGVVAGEAARAFGDDLSGLDNALAASSGWRANLGKVTGLIENLSIATKLIPNRFEDAAESLAEYDDVLSGLIAAGDMESYSLLLEEITRRAEAQGISQERLAELLPKSSVAFEDAANAVTEASDATEQADAGTRTLTDSYNALTGATEQLTEAQVEWRAEMGEINASFIDLIGGYDSLVAKNQEAAQATADATESASDSWEDYYDGFSVNLTEYLDELQRQVDAQNEWETNMVLLAGRVSQGVLDELARMGPEGAPLVAQMVNATDEELARMEVVYGERSAQATGAFVTTLDTARPVIAAAGAQLGQETAAEIAAKLQAGTATVAQIVHDYELEIEGITPEVQIDTSYAYNEMQNFISAYTNRSITIRVVPDVGAMTAAQLNNYGLARTAYSGLGHAEGGYITGPGTSTSDSIPALLSNGEYVIKADAVDRYGKQTFDALNAMRFASGGYVGPASSSGLAVAGGRTEVVGAKYLGPVYQGDPDYVARQTASRVRDALTTYGVTA